ncbi:MAG: hypothetical protein WCE52_21720 [Candidatus Acidiferrum sp.]
MPRFLFALALFICAFAPANPAQDHSPALTPHYLFAWTGDLAHKGNDFLAVIDANPASPSYGQLLTTLATDQQTIRVHHTEYTMPASGMLFANDHDAGRTFIFDLRDPLHPKTVMSFTNMAGYMHPHSYLRLPDGNILATFQHTEHSMSAMSDAAMPAPSGKTGGLVEIDDHGKVIRSASNADPSFPNALLTPYSLVVLPEIDRVVSTNSSMHDDDIFSGVTYQVWRLSDLKLLKTSYFDVGENRYAQISPEEPRRAPDGSVFVQTLGCGLEHLTAIDTDQPVSHLAFTFPGNWCGVPTIVGHYLVQSVPAIHGLVVLDIANAAKPVEVCRLKITDIYMPHWTAWDPVMQRLVITSSALPSNNRMFLLKLDQSTGQLSIDDAFRGSDHQPGFNFDNRQWPHNWQGNGYPHGAVFSR